MQKVDLLQTKFEQEMKSSGLRNTHVRQGIFKVLLETEKPLSIQELVDKVDNSHFVSVYRSIDAMHKAGIVKQVPRGFKYLFELSDKFKPHHHHATCEVCGKSTSVHSDQLEDLMNRLTIDSGLKPTSHTFELFGICGNCKLR